ncbi:hypothetical protein SV7mr_23910 [Stieleria bergensis]|uniref:Uncharacterized protein n=1 Tax=Stieleria bergensis TaxID=2528025 RepID=A0A517SUU2_9BACT|nr:hypothetical protein SV7mr_23910 [Planctomycetes bacterium SV_7m_r]
MNTENDPFSVNNPYRVSSAELAKDDLVDPAAALQARRGSSGFAVVAIAMFVLTLIAGGLLLLLVIQFASVHFSNLPLGPSIVSIEPIVALPGWLAMLAVPVGQMICYRVPDAVVSKAMLAGCLLGYLATLAVLVLAVLGSFVLALQESPLIMMVVVVIGAIIAYCAPMVSQLFFVSHVRLLAKRVGAGEAASWAFLARVGLIAAPILLFVVAGLSSLVNDGDAAIGVILAALSLSSLAIGAGAMFVYGLSCWKLYRYLANAST